MAKYIKKYRYLIMFFSLILFLFILEDVCEYDIYKMDVIGYNFISKHFMNDTITKIAKIITNFGGSIVIIVGTIILSLVYKNKINKIATIINSLSITLLNQILKFIVERPRPIEHRLIDESGYSFPSGHSMVSFAFYGFLAFLIYKNVKNIYLRYFLIVLLSLLVLAIGFSRIYLGVHYTSDVIAGFLMSLSYLIIFIDIYNGAVKKYEK